MCQTIGLSTRWFIVTLVCHPSVPRLGIRSPLCMYVSITLPPPPPLCITPRSMCHQSITTPSVGWGLWHVWRTSVYSGHFLGHSPLSYDLSTPLPPILEVPTTQGILEIQAIKHLTPVHKKSHNLMCPYKILHSLPWWWPYHVNI